MPIGQVVMFAIATQERRTRGVNNSSVPLAPSWVDNKLALEKRFSPNRSQSELGNTVLYLSNTPVTIQPSGKFSVYSDCLRGNTLVSQGNIQSNQQLWFSS